MSAQPTGATVRRRMRADERRAQLVRCALAGFARRGLARAAHADVAADAGVAVSTVFRYFPTRDALVAAVLDEVEGLYLRLAEQAHTRAAPAAVVLRDHGRRVRDAVAAHPDEVAVWLDWSTAIGDAAWPRYLAMVERAVAIGRHTLRRGQREGSVPASLDVEAAARLLVGHSQLLAQLELSRADAAHIQAVAEAAVASVLVGRGAGLEASAASG